jgi:hypothetical protein
MESETNIRTDLARKIQACLKEAGVAAEVSASKDEVIVVGQVEEGGRTVRVITQISDRTVVPEGYGPVVHDIARARLGNAIVRPSLGARSFGQQRSGSSVTGEQKGRPEEKQAE